MIDIDVNKFLNDDNSWGTDHKVMFLVHFEGYEIAKTKYITDFLREYIKKSIEKTTLKFFEGYVRNAKDNPVASNNKKEFKKEFLKYNKTFFKKDTKEDIKKDIFELITHYLKYDNTRVVGKIIEKTNEDKILNIFDKIKLKNIINEKTKSNFERKELLKALNK